MKRLLLVCVAFCALAMPAGALASGVVLKVERGAHLVAVVRSERVLLVHGGMVGRLRVGDRIGVRGRMLRNGTFAATRVRLLGHAGSVAFRGLLLSRGGGDRLTVSAGGMPVTVGATGAAGSAGQPGSEVEVDADVNEAGQLHANTVAVVAATAPAGSLEGHLLAIGSGTITVGSEHQVLALTVPSGFDLSGFTVGEEVLAVFSQQSDGSLLLTSLSGDQNAQAANQGEDNQGDDNAGGDSSGSDDNSSATSSVGDGGGDNTTVGAPAAGGDSGGDGATAASGSDGGGDTGGVSSSDGGSGGDSGGDG